MNNKILIVGPSFFGYTASIANSFLKKGFITKVVEYKYVYTFKEKIISMWKSVFGVKKKVIPSKKTLNRISNEIIDIYIEFNPKYVLCINCEIFDDDLFRTFNKSINFLWALDLIERYPQIENSFKYFDEIFFYDKHDAEIYKKIGFNTSFLPDFYDDSKFFYMPDSKKKIDILVIGAMYKNRYLVLKQLIKDFPDLNIKIYGCYIRKMEILKRIKWLISGDYKHFTNKNVDLENANILTNMSKISINIQYEKAKYSANMRFFEIASTKTFQIVNENDYFLNELNNVNCYSNYDELKKLIEEFLFNENKFKDNIESLYTNVKQNHKVENRVQVLMDHFLKNNNERK